MKKEYLNKLRIFKLGINDFFVFYLAAAFFISSFIHDDTWPYIGWEVPKVRFLQVALSILLLLILVHHIFLIYKKKYRPNKVTIFIALTTIFITLSTFLADFYRSITVKNDFLFTKENKFYSFFANICGYDNDTYRQSLFGNIFREQGLITIVLIILVCWNIRRYITKSNIHILFSSIIASSFIQSFIAFEQFSDLYTNNRDLLKEGLYVYGRFGQANFFAGHQLFGMILCLYYAKKQKLFIVPALVIFASLSMTYSSWTVITIIILVPFILIYETNKEFTKLLLIMPAIIFISALPIANYFLTRHEEYSYRLQIWDGVINGHIIQPIKHPDSGNIRLLIYGSGYDNLGDFLIEKDWNNSKTIPQYVDRAHNIFWDVLASNGLVGLFIFVLIIQRPVLKFKKNYKSRIFVYSCFAFYGFIFRSFVTEYSIVNLLYMFIILACIYSVMERRNEM